MEDGYLKVATRQSGASEKFCYAKQTAFMSACSSAAWAKGNAGCSSQRSAMSAYICYLPKALPKTPTS
jgi:hypothetical protein